MAHLGPQDTDTINLELAMADLLQIEKRQQRKVKGKGKDEEEAAKVKPALPFPVRNPFLVANPAMCDGLVSVPVEAAICSSESVLGCRVSAASLGS